MRWAGAFHLAPGLLLKFLVWALQVSDYFWLPAQLHHPSLALPRVAVHYLHGLTSGILAHLPSSVRFRNVPVFWSFGRKRQAFEYQWDGTVARRR